MTNILNYSGPATRQKSIGAGYWLMLVPNVCSLIFFGGLLVKDGVLQRSTGLIGDSYAPMLGLFIGVPCTLVQLLFGTLPAIIYFARFIHVKNRRAVFVLAIVSILAGLACAGLTIACIAAPRTHGSSC
jgi:hypothetical protein